MPHNRPEDMPPDAERLTTYQFELLSVLFVKGHSLEGDPVPVVWSPTKITGRTLTRAEASTLSTRLKTLVQRGFIKRYGNELFITEWGKYALRTYASKEQNAKRLLARVVLATLNFWEAKEEIKAYKKVLSIMEARPLPPEKRDAILYAIRNSMFASIVMEQGAHAELMKLREEYKSKEGSN